MRKLFVSVPMKGKTVARKLKSTQKYILDLCYYYHARITNKGIDYTSVPFSHAMQGPLSPTCMAILLEGGDCDG